VTEFDHTLAYLLAYSLYYDGCAERNEHIYPTVKRRYLYRNK